MHCVTHCVGSSTTRKRSDASRSLALTQRDLCRDRPWSEAEQRALREGVVQAVQEAVFGRALDEMQARVAAGAASDAAAEIDAARIGVAELSADQPRAFVLGPEMEC